MVHRSEADSGDGGTGAGPPPPPLSSAGGAAGGPDGLLAITALSRASRGQGEEAVRRRDRPRLSVRPVHALVAVLILATALAASLTLLVQQYLSIRSLEPYPVQAGAGPSRKGASGKPGSMQAEGGQAAGKPTGGGGRSSAGPSSPGGVSGPAGQNAGPHGGDGGSAPVDINTATADQLMSIKGIGPVMAGKIVDRRKKIGRFSSLDQLMEIPGLGARTLQKIRPWLVVG
ncbi:ComEA family DNA-binding protein [Bifidobacterium favimelis]|uniref:ComEA family DNA-binding protein n=1 Tax=Bifidobacterium favimelis TaxID=3122979 RepID=UPI0030E8C011